MMRVKEGGFNLMSTNNTNKVKNNANDWQEKMMQNKALQTLQKFGNACAANNYIGALMGGVQSMLGIMMVSALAQVICAALVLAKVIEKGDSVYNILYTPYTFCMAFLSLWLCIAMGYIYAGKLKLQSQIVSAITTTVSFLIAVDARQVDEAGKAYLDVSYFGATGMITVFFIVFISCNIIKFFESKNITFKLPKGSAEGLMSSFVSMIPLFVNVVFFFALSKLCTAVTGNSIPNAIMAVLGVPFSALTSAPGMFIVSLLMALFSFFGVTSTMIVGPILLPLIMQALEENAALYTSGQDLLYFPVLLFYCFNVYGMLPLIFLGFNSKSKQIKTICRAGLVPSCFTIHDVVMFGLPVIYNPILGIPYILNQLFCTLAYHLVFTFKLLTPMWIYVTGNTPLGIKEFLWSMDWRHIIFAWVLVIPAMLIYFPFFKVYEKQIIEKEQAAKQEEIEAKDESVAKAEALETK